jgi:spore maturation protein CgeB
LKILVADTAYREFLRSHYRSTPGLEREPYGVQWRALMDTFFGTSDAYSHFLGPLGHEAQEVVLNCEPLQRAWANEHGVRISPRLERLRRRDWRHGVLLAQARALKPDVVYVQDLGVLPPAVLRGLRRRARLLVGQIASELPPAETLRQFDLVLTSFPHYVDRLRALGIETEYFRIGFDPRVLGRLDRPERRGVVFVGSLRRERHGRGNELIARAAERVPVEFYGYGAEDWPEGSTVRKGYRGEAWGLDMYRVFAGAKIVLNRHLTAAEDFANNMRLFEATGVGALLLTDAKRNLGELFEVGREVVAYDGEDDLVAAVSHYLEHEDERAAIAEAGQQRTLREHSYEARMQELAELLSRRLPVRPERG